MTKEERVFRALMELRLGRRRAISTVGKSAIAVAGALILGGGTLAYIAGLTPRLSTVTTVATETTAATKGSSTSNSPCTISPALTEGPYFVDEKLNRQDVRSNPPDNSIQEGVQLRLKLNVNRVSDNTCIPLTGANVDIWHANSQGVYSDVQAQNTVGKKFLRGYQVTDENGAVEFITIYPGWYPGRSVHIHIKIRNFSGLQKTYEFTSQLFFDDSISDQVFAQAPYNTRGPRDTKNSSDSVYTGPSTDGALQKNSGMQLMLQLNKDAQGYVGTSNIGIKT